MFTESKVMKKTSEVPNVFELFRVPPNFGYAEVTEFFCNGR